MNFKFDNPKEAQQQNSEETIINQMEDHLDEEKELEDDSENSVE